MWMGGAMSVVCRRWSSAWIATVEGESAELESRGRGCPFGRSIAEFDAAGGGSGREVLRVSVGMDEGAASAILVRR